MSEHNADVAELSYEQAREELKEIVAKLEAGPSTLDESLNLWERGEALANRCQHWLDSARQRIQAVQQGMRQDASGSPTAGSGPDA